MYFSDDHGIGATLRISGSTFKDSVAVQGAAINLNSGILLMNTTTLSNLLANKGLLSAPGALRLLLIVADRRSFTQALRLP